MPAKIIDGRKIAQQLREQIAKEIVSLQSTYSIPPRITTITFGKEPTSDLYRKLREKACGKVGIETRHVEFPSTVTEATIVKTIRTMNKDAQVHGILIQYPMPAHISPDLLMSAIDPKKDVEGFHPYNMGRILAGDEHITPCTPLAILTILDHEKTVIKGQDIVVVNHSTVVGKPLTALLLNRDATVSVCHVYTKNLKHYTQGASVLITAAGIPQLITSDHIQKNAFVIDVGIVKTMDGICGDVDFHSVKQKAGKLTPVPGGVGPVTIACSLQNMIKTYLNCMEEHE